jgi:hypothetical protein
MAGFYLDNYFLSFFNSSKSALTTLSSLGFGFSSPTNSGHYGDSDSRSQVRFIGGVQFQ